jgi:hypothetical protein
VLQKTKLRKFTNIYRKLLNKGPYIYRCWCILLLNSVGRSIRCALAAQCPTFNPLS